MVCLKCDHKRPIASNPAEIASQPLNNSVMNHQTQHWHEQEKSSSRYYRGEDSVKFVNSENEDQIGSSSWDEATGFKDFPVAGGKSELSRDQQKRESWKMEMAAKSRNAIHKRDDSTRHDSYIFRGTRKSPPSEDDDDDMTEWFGKGLGS